MSDHQPAQFTRETVKHEPRVRRLVVARARNVTPTIARVTLTGELDGFSAPGFDDHVKAFFPGPEGRIVAPALIDGRLKRTSKEHAISRDYTVRAFREATEHSPAELDLDFVLHGADGSGSAHAGPASSWAAAAAPGDELIVVGPKRSHLTPAGVTPVVVIADETAFPATARLLDAMHGVPAVCLLVVGDVDHARAYFEGHPGEPELRCFTGSTAIADLEASVRSQAIDPGTFVFAAGEKRMLIPVRKYLKKELDLAKRQVETHGYWKHRGRDPRTAPAGK